MELGEIIRHYPDYYQNGSNMSLYDLYYQLYYNIIHPLAISQAHSWGSISCTSTHIVCISSFSTFLKQGGGDKVSCATFTLRIRHLSMLIAVEDYRTTCCSECYLCFAVMIGCDSKCSGLDPYQHISSNSRRVTRAALPYYPPGHVSWLYSSRLLLSVFLLRMSVFLPLYFPKSMSWRLDMYTNVFIDDQPSIVAYENWGIADENAMHGNYILESRHGQASSDVGFSATCSASVDIGFTTTIAKLGDVSSGVTTCSPTRIQGSSCSVGEFYKVSSHVIACSPRKDDKGSSPSIGAICCPRINESCFTKTVGEVGSLASKYYQPLLVEHAFPWSRELTRLLQSMFSLLRSLPYVRHHVLLFLAIPNLHKILLSLL
ncbi:hypothetical protein M9H77_12433 [Catharanthus roseus]|uniref:Uncharacterized protein n=1 Tax=Catharanthus roseus TaxID=4058 RepID=A0ACC0BHK5_CATRO|nr:hypothetical protein M9H77_12433 [Catharanthus roseus]